MTLRDLGLVVELLAGTLALGVAVGILAALALTLRDLARGRTVEECSRDWPHWLSCPRSLPSRLFRRTEGCSCTAATPRRTA